MMVMMMMMILLILISVKIMMRECAISSVTYHIQIPNFMWLSSSHSCCTHFAICQTDRTATALSCMSQQ
jgi:hypothetical protein